MRVAKTDLLPSHTFQSAGTICPPTPLACFKVSGPRERGPSRCKLIRLMNVKRSRLQRGLGKQIRKDSNQMTWITQRRNNLVRPDGGQFSSHRVPKRNVCGFSSDVSCFRCCHLRSRELHSRVHSKMKLTLSGIWKIPGDCDGQFGHVWYKVTNKLR